MRARFLLWDTIPRRIQVLYLAAKDPTMEVTITIVAIVAPTSGEP